MKRIISAFLSCTLLLTVVLPSLSGCSGASNKYTVGEWLRKVNEMFSLSYFTQAEPLVNGVSEDDEYFAAVQIAADWGVIDEGSTIKTSAEITREFCADTLVRAMNFDYDTAPDIKDADKLSCARTVGIALNEGIMTLDGSGKFNPSKKVSKTDADIALLTAYDKWINLSYEGDEYFEAEVKEGVVNLGGLDSDLSPVSCTPDDYSVSYSKTTLTFDDNGQIVDDIDKTITFKNASSLPAGITTGSVLTLPADEVMPSMYGVVVTEIVTNADGSVTLSTKSAELGEIFDNFSSRNSMSIDFSNAIFYDMEGNRLDIPVNNSADMIYKGSSEDVLDCSNDTYQVGKKNGNTINVGDLFECTFSVEHGGLKAVTTLKDAKSTIKFTHTAVMDNLKIEESDDIQFTEDLKVFGHEVNIFGYKLQKFAPKVNEFRFSASFDTHQTYSIDAGLSAKYSSKKDSSSSSDGDLKQLYSDIQSEYQEKNGILSPCASDMSTRLMFCTIPGWVISPSFVLRANLSLDGNITYSLSTAEQMGVEYLNGNIRPIQEHRTTDRSLSVEARAELTVSGDFGIALGTYELANVGLEGGVGVYGKSRMYEVNPSTDSVLSECYLPVCYDSVPLSSGTGQSEENSNAYANRYSIGENIKSCTTVKVYPILRIHALKYGDTLLGMVCRGFDNEIFGEDDAFINIHYENDNGMVESCTRELETGVEIQEGKDLTLNVEALSIGIGEDQVCHDLKVVTIPKGYKATDLVVTSEDESIAVGEFILEQSQKEKAKAPWKLIAAGDLAAAAQAIMDMNMKYIEYGGTNCDHTALTGKTDGVTMITVATKDGKYSAQVKVVVGNGGFGDAVIGSFLPKVYAYSLDPGATAKIEIGALPKDITAADIQYTSRDTAVATVSASGLITAVGDGVTTIDITTTDGNYKASVSVFVYEGAAAAIAESAA